jgi:Fe-S oxidoreductase
MLKLENYEAIINKCSHCGYCQATCPVYLEDMLESHVARNRLNLINQVLILKTMPSTPRFRETLLIKSLLLASKPLPGFITPVKHFHKPELT